MEIPWQFEVIRFWSVGRAVAQVLGVEPAPECRIEHGRTTLIFRRLGASRWPEGQQVEYAFRVASVARDVLIDDRRWKVRRAAKKAKVIVFEDASTVQGSAVIARWECVVPAESR
jgi:hypothetical protein